MGEFTSDTDYLVRECETVATNSLYNAESHYTLAEIKERKGLWLIVIPSAVAGICSLLVAIGLPTALGALGAGGGLVATVAGILGVDRQPTVHRLAGSQWTALRHEARSLSQGMFKELPHQQFVAEVRRLCDRYNTLCQALPSTDNESFDKARKRIKKGIHEPDTKREPN
jgi:hypothetical protein